MIARYTADGSPLVIAEPYAARLANGPWDEPPLVDGQPGSEGRAVRVCQLLAGAPPGRLSSELEREGEDIVVVLLTEDPANLPVGHLLDEVLRHGHRVVEASPVASRMARAVLVLTRDPEVPMASYLLGTPLNGSDAVRRALGEHAVDGLVTRAQRAKDAERLAALTNEVTALRASEEAARENATAAQTQLAEVTSRLAAHEAATLSSRIGRGLRLAGRAVEVVREDPRGGSVTVARAAGRRIRRRD